MCGFCYLVCVRVWLLWYLVLSWLYALLSCLVVVLLNVCVRLFVVYCCLLACLTLVGDFAWVGGFRWFLWFCFIGGFDSFGGFAGYAG